MAYIEGNFPPLKVFLRNEYMYQGKEGNDTIYVDYYSPEKVV